MGWFKEHLNRTIKITFVLLGALNLIGGFLGFLMAYMIGINLLVVVLLAASMFNLAVLVSLSWSVFRERDIPMKDLFWLVIPSALISLLALVGFKIFEAIDRANPSF